VEALRPRAALAQVHHQALLRRGVIDVVDAEAAPGAQRAAAGSTAVQRASTTAMYWRAAVLVGFSATRPKPPTVRKKASGQAQGAKQPSSKIVWCRPKRWISLAATGEATSE
jgi:hypothetical protein